MAPLGPTKSFKANEIVHVDVLKFLMFTLAVTWDGRQRNTTLPPVILFRGQGSVGGYILKPFQSCLEKLCGRRDMGDPFAP